MGWDLLRLLPGYAIFIGDSLMDSEPNTHSPPAPKSRSSVVIGGLLICAILLPLMIYYRMQPKVGGDIEIETVNELDPRVRFYSEAEPPWEAGMKADFKKLSSQLLAKCDNIEDQVDEAERRRCLADPHLAASINEPYSTPFVGPNSRLPATLTAERLQVVDLLIKDYEKNSLDKPDLKAKLIPLMRATLLAFWKDWRRQGYEELSQVDMEKPDPLFCYCLIKSANEQDVFMRSIERAKSAIPMRPTHPFLRFAVSVNGKDANEEIPVDQKILMVDAVVDFVSHHQDDKALLSIMFSEIKSMTSRSNSYISLDLAVRLNALKSPACPEWILQYLFSSMNERIVNRYRGTEYISNVTAENLKVFEEYSEIQAKHLLRAWVLAPDQIALYQDLIWAEGRSGETHRSKEVWLRHALATQVDCAEVVDQYVNLLMPRWGGTESKMFWLADKCSEAIGVEAELPFYFWYPIKTWCVDNGYQANAGLPTPLKATLRIVEFLKKQPEDYRHPLINGAREAMMIRILWDAGQLAELNWLLDRYSSAIGGWKTIVHSLDLTFIEQVCHAAAQEDASDCWAVIHSQLLLDSRTLNSEGLDRVRMAIDEAESYATEEKSKAALVSCRKLYGWAKSYYDGQETLLDFDEHMSGWMVVARHQRFNIDSADGSPPAVELTSYSASKVCVLKPLLRFQPPYKFEATVLFKSGGPDQYGLALQAGPSGFYSSDCKGVELRFNPIRGHVAFDRLPVEKGDYGLKIVSLTDTQKAHRLRLDVLTNRAIAFLDDKEIATYDSPLETHGIVQFGREIGWNFGGAANPTDTVTFALSDVKITRIGTTSDDLPITAKNPTADFVSRLPKEAATTLNYKDAR